MTKSEAIKQKYESYKNFLENNTQEEVDSARKLLFGNSSRNRRKAPSTVSIGVTRPTISS